MAKAKKIPATYTVEITLDQNEAEFLLAVTRCIGGEPMTTRRKYAYTIEKALREAGVTGCNTSDISQSNSSIWFK